MVSGKQNEHLLLQDSCEVKDEVKKGEIKRYVPRKRNDDLLWPKYLWSKSWSKKLRSQEAKRLLLPTKLSVK